MQHGGHHIHFKVIFAVFFLPFSNNISHFTGTCSNIACFEASRIPEIIPVKRLPARLPVHQPEMSLQQH